MSKHEETKEPINVANVLLKGRVHRLLQNLDPQDLVLLSRGGESTQYKKNGTYTKGSKKGGKPPSDYTAAELKADLEMEMRKEDKDIDFAFLLACYLRLTRMLKF